MVPVYRPVVHLQRRLAGQDAVADGALVRVAQLRLDVLHQLLQFRRLRLVDLHVLLHRVLAVLGRQQRRWRAVHQERIGWAEGRQTGRGQTGWKPGHRHERRREVNARWRHGENRVRRHWRPRLFGVSRRVSACRGGGGVADVRRRARRDVAARGRVEQVRLASPLLIAVHVDLRLHHGLHFFGVAGKRNLLGGRVFRGRRRDEAARTVRRDRSDQDRRVLTVGVVEMLGYHVLVHLDVRVLALVALEVHLEVAFGGEAVETDVALVRALACNDREKGNVSLNVVIQRVQLFFPSMDSCGAVCICCKPTQTNNLRLSFQQTERSRRFHDGF